MDGGNRKSRTPFMTSSARTEMGMIEIQYIFSLLAISV